MNLLEKYVEDNLPDELNLAKTTFGHLSIGLNDHEKALVYKYTDDGYKINSALISSKGLDFNDYGIFLLHTINKLPNYTGIVYRKVYLSPSELAKYLDAKLSQLPIQEHFFISASKFISLALFWKGLTTFKPNCLFVIFTRTGKEIELLSKYNDEKEVLLIPNSNFTVLDVQIEPSFIQITMEQL